MGKFWGVINLTSCMVCAESIRSETGDLEVCQLVGSSARRLLASCDVAMSWCSRHSAELQTSTSSAVRDTLLVYLADLPVRISLMSVIYLANAASF